MARLSLGSGSVKSNGITTDPWEELKREYKVDSNVKIDLPDELKTRLGIETGPDPWEELKRNVEERHYKQIQETHLGFGEFQQAQQSTITKPSLQSNTQTQPQTSSRLGMGDFQQAQRSQQPAIYAAKNVQQPIIAKLGDFIDKVGQTLKSAGYGIAKGVGADAVTRIVNSVIKGQINKQKKLGIDTSLWEDAWKDTTEDENFKSWMGVSLAKKYEPTAAVNVAKTVGNIVGNIVQIVSVGSLAAQLGVGNEFLSKLIPQLTTGAAVGATQAYGEGKGAKEIAQSAAREATFFGAGGIASDVVSPLIDTFLFKAVTKRPQLNTIALGISNAVKSGAFTLGGLAASYPLYGKEKPSIGQMAKDVLINTVAGGILGYWGPTKRLIEPQNIKPVYMSEEELIKNGYKIFNPRTKEWIDPVKTGQRLSSGQVGGTYAKFDPKTRTLYVADGYFVDTVGDIGAAASQATGGMPPAVVPPERAPQPEPLVRPEVIDKTQRPSVPSIMVPQLMEAMGVTTPVPPTNVPQLESPATSETPQIQAPPKTTSTQQSLSESSDQIATILQQLSDIESKKGQLSIRDSETVPLLQKLGQLDTGVTLSYADEVGKLRYLLYKGELTQDEWEKELIDLYRSNKISNKEVFKAHYPDIVHKVETLEPSKTNKQQPETTKAPQPKQYEVKEVNRLAASAEDLAADYKARGLDKFAAWDQFIIDRSLRPEMDAKDFYKIYNSVSPKRLREGFAGKVTPTHILRQVGGTVDLKIQILKDTPDRIDWITDFGMTGSTPKNLIEKLVPIKTEQAQKQAEPPIQQTQSKTATTQQPMQQVQQGPKEPWQMTYEEFAKKYDIRRQRERKLFEKIKDELEKVGGVQRAKEIYLMLPDETLEQFVKRITSMESKWEGSRKLQDSAIQFLSKKNIFGERGEGLRKALLDYARWKRKGWATREEFESKKVARMIDHQKIVEQALKENKPVPEEVLKDYPELTSKIKTTTTQQPTPEPPTQQTTEAPKQTAEVPPEYEGKPNPNEVLGVVAPGTKVKVDTSQPFTYDDPTLEAIHQANHGVHKNHIKEISEGIRSLYYMATRTFADLPETGQFAKAKKYLVYLPKIRALSVDRTIRILKDIVKPLNAVDKNTFERYVELLDYAEDAKNGLSLPNGFTPEAVERELERIKPYLNDNVMEAVKKRKQYWNTLKEEYIKAMDNLGIHMESRFKRTDYFRHQVLEYVKLKEATNAINGVQVSTSRSFVKERTGAAQNINTDYLQAEYEVISQIIHDTEVAKTIKQLMDKYDISGQIKGDQIPEGYTKWQAKPGNMFYLADSIPQKIADQLLEGVLKEAKISADDIRKVLAVGHKYREYVIPQELAATLEHLYKIIPNNEFEKMVKTVQNYWKEWVLTGNPLTVIKYNVRNLLGDIDAVFAADPTIFKYAPQAYKELVDAFKYDKFTSELKEWYDQGGFQSLLYTQEIRDINKIPDFKKYYKNKDYNLVRKYLNMTRDMTNLREAVLRYAAYLRAKELLTKSEGKLTYYWASKKDIIDNLDTIEEKAYKLQNDLLGAYDEVSQMGQHLRKYWIPFFSWLEVNFKRYIRLFANALTQDKVHRKLLHLLYIFLPTAVLTAWNLLMYPKEEEELPVGVKERPHIVLGKDKDGNILYFSRLGSLSDFLEWFGLDTVPQDIKDLMNGKTTIKEQLAKMAKSPLNKIVSTVSPFYKTPFEVAAGISFYPDVTAPSSIRDKMLYIAQQLGIPEEYKVVAGLPHRPYFTTLSRALLYKVDPEESAYYAILDLKRKFQKKIGKEGTPAIIGYSAKSNALYNLKLAMKYGDKQATIKYLRRYVELSGAKTDKELEQGLKQSFASMNPLYGLSDEEAKAFVDWLSESDRQKLAMAIKFYEDVITGTKLSSK